MKGQKQETMNYFDPTTGQITKECGTELWNMLDRMTPDGINDVVRLIRSIRDGMTEQFPEKDRVILQRWYDDMLNICDEKLIQKGY